MLLSGVSRISFQGGGGVQNIFEKVGVFGYLHGAKRYMQRVAIYATRLLEGFRGMLPRFFFKLCNLVRFGEYCAKILSQKIVKICIFHIKNDR